MDGFWDRFWVFRVPTKFFLTFLALDFDKKWKFQVILSYGNKQHPDVYGNTLIPGSLFIGIESYKGMQKQYWCHPLI